MADRPAASTAVALAITLVALVPLWLTSWLRDDWLLLWHALEPATAPARATGFFPRPVAELAWKLGVAMSGDLPWGMHLVTTLAWCALVGGAWRWARHWGARSLGAAVALALWCAGHATLVEPRQWAAASNAVLAFAMGVWGVWWLRPGPSAGFRGRWILGALLLAAGVLARADAVLLLAFPVAEGLLRSRRAGLFALAAFVLAGVGALAWMLASAGHWTFLPEKGMRLAGLAFVPWGLGRVGGPGLAALLAAVIVATGLLAGRHEGRRPAALALLLGVGGVLVGGSVVSWPVAGRYVLGEVVPLAVFVALLVETGARGSRHRWLAALLLALGLLHLSAALAGRTSRHLRAVSHAETSLYTWAAERTTPLPDRVEVGDAPPMGWTDSAADAENVLSAAARRRIAVGPNGTVRVRWTGEEWREDPPARLP